MKKSKQIGLVLIKTALLFTLAGSGIAAASEIDDASATTDTARMVTGIKVPSTEVSHEEAAQAADYAVRFIGTPYRYGGSTPKAGFDCSGLINYVYKAVAKVVPPRTVALLKNWGNAVSQRELRAGDLVIFAQKKQPDHAGVYLGDGTFVHAPRTGTRVRVESLNSQYWSSKIVAFRRP